MPVLSRSNVPKAKASSFKMKSNQITAEVYSDSDADSVPFQNEDDDEEGSESNYESGDDDDSTNMNESISNDAHNNSTELDKLNNSLPLNERLKMMQESNKLNSFHSINTRKIKQARPNRSDEESTSTSSNLKRLNKNAPAVMSSNRAVPILRSESLYNITKVKSVDPRFSSASAGTLDYDKFVNDYKFLDEMQQVEISKLDKKMKKMKNEELKETVKAELMKKRQEMIERRRAIKINAAVKEAFHEEKEKVKQGKNPYFMKKSDIKNIALDQRYKELKSGGKLQKFLTKKRKRNASKDHVSMPSRTSRKFE